MNLPHDELRRTARQMNLPGFGLDQQIALNRAHVLVIGAGGLGCPLLQTLAATGVGRITIIDDDVVTISNIHRQILFGASDVGRRKVDVVAERLRALQPSIELELIFERLSTTNALSLLEGVDVLIDGSDTFTTKFLAADAAEISCVPLVWGSVLRYRGDVALWWSGNCAPEGGVGMRDLYPTQPDPNSVPDCATAGVLGVTTSVVGSLMATEVVKLLTGVGESVVGKLLSYDALTATMRAFQVSRDPGRELVTELGSYPEAACVVTGGHDLADAVSRGESVGLDVREAHEKALVDVPGGSLHLPTSVWESNPDTGRELLEEIPAGSQVVVYCASGQRSDRFVERFEAFASERGINLRSLPGGAGAHGRENC